MAWRGDPTPPEPKLPSLPWRATFTPEDANLNAARAGLTHALNDVGVSGPAIDDALLVLNEMTSNAIRHARTEYTITATLTAGTLRLEVFDRDTRPPSLLGLDDQSTSGRGLHLIAALASDWGWRTATSQDGVSGKLVWAEMHVGQPKTDA
jgi:anti-sigma regulatory factor (Ser/Thr protein kinase)